MTFNVINDGDAGIASTAMQNWRHNGVGYGSSNVLPVNSIGAGTNNTIDIGSSSFAFKDVYVVGTFKNDFSINTDKFTIASATGNTSVAGTLGVTGVTTLSNILNVVKDDSSGNPLAYIHNTNTGGAGNGLKIELDSVSGTGNYALSVDVNAGTAFYVREDGKCGIGTTSPVSELDVKKNQDGFTSIRIENANTEVNACAILQLASNDGAVRTWYVGQGSSGVLGTRTKQNYLGFWNTDNYEVARMVLTYDGKLGINDTTPTHQLDVNGTFRTTGAATLDSTLGVTGNITVNTDKLIVTASTGAISAGANAEVWSTFGYARIGDIDGFTDIATFAHLDFNTTASYALRQNNTGATVLNCASGQTLALAQATVTKLEITAGGNVNVASDFSVATDKFTVASATGNTVVAGTLGITGATTLSSTLGVTGNLTVNTDKVTITATTGAISAGANADVWSTFGYARIGDLDGFTDIATFAHLDFNTTASYALRQNNTGATVLNCASGQTLSLSQATVTKLEIDASGNTKVHGDLYTVPWTNYFSTSSKVGWSSYVTEIIEYKKVGNLVFVKFNIAGTSSSASATFTLPYTSANDGIYTHSPIYFVNNSTNSVYSGSLMLEPNDNVAKCYVNWNFGGWTSSNEKTVRGEFWYEAQ